MSYTPLIVELLLFALGLSLFINALHIAFQKEMALNWLYKWLEAIFKIKPYYDFKDCIDKGKIYGFSIEKIYDSETKEYIGYLYDKVYKDLRIQHITVKGEEKCKYFKLGIEVDEHSKIHINSKWRNQSGLLYIAKPIYACASCMPSIWSLPLLLILVWWKVLFIAIFAVVISTLINDKIYE